MKVALTTWNGRISPVLDVARQVEVLDVEGGRIVARRDEPLPGTDPPAQARRLGEIGPDVLICGAVSRPMADSLASAGIRVLPFVAGPCEQVCDAWLAGHLPGPGFAMPGCGGPGRCRNRRRRCGGRPWGGDTGGHSNGNGRKTT